MNQKIMLVARVVLGLIFVVMGLNFFFGFIQQPEMEGKAAAFMGGLFQSGYFFPFMKIVEISMGTLLILRIVPALALTILAPIILNIFLFHVFLAPAGLPVAIVLVALEGYLAWSYREKYAPLFRA